MNHQTKAAKRILSARRKTIQSCKCSEFSFCHWTFGQVWWFI